ncbi:dihydrodipicolinate synthase family protein [Mediterraneibacter sp. NSJ-55]|uniref:Dihydrodipicolinate synthase family protein n=1 Tax=Mediterraneibacter hominis TaxID=2763054 RepID=A0A923LIR5_9FIRM|nr:dihydrodipicolinate synthase family protein [Mediterraneibacter hominis]MBC5689426.1 dihydrodipicolinate synthase family protein [Mediterraneibacter hominis]
MISRKEMISASITIFDENNHIDDAEMQKLWKKNIKEGADGFFIGGSVGECFLLSTEERIHMFELASSTLHDLDIYAHVGSISTDHAIEMAKAALSCGIKYIASTPPFYFAFTTKELAHYYYDLAEAAGRPVLYYDIPSSTHADLNTDDAEIRALLKSGAIGMIKHTNLQSYRMKRIKSINPDIKIMGGFESRMIPMLNYHCDGFIGSTFNFMLPQYNKIVELYETPQKSEIYKIISASTDILQILLNVGLPASIKYILGRQGIRAGNVRRPLLPLNDAAKAKLDAVIDKKLIYNN